MQTALRPNRGFTLIELILVLSVLSIFASLAAPSFLSSMNLQKARSVANQLYTDIYWAKEEAIKRHESVTISFAENGWTINKFSDASQLKAAPAQYGDVSVRASAELTFDGVRGLTNASTIEVSTAGGVVNLTVVPLGYVDICSNTISGYLRC